MLFGKLIRGQSASASKADTGQAPGWGGADGAAIAASCQNPRRLYSGPGFPNNFQRNPIVFVKKSSGVCKQDAKSASQSYSRVHIFSISWPTCSQKAWTSAYTRSTIEHRFLSYESMSSLMIKREASRHNNKHFKLLNLLIRMCIKGVKMALSC